MQTALLIVDMQNDFVLPSAAACIRGAQATVPSIVRLLSGARAQGWTVVHVIREYRADATDVEVPRRKRFLELGGYAVTGTAGAQIIPELAPTAAERVVVKPRFSGFMTTPLEAVLRAAAVTRVVICGTQYPNCIRATALDALALDFDVVVALDATSAQTPEIAAANVLDLRNVGIPCLPVDEVLTLPALPS
jgi:nicotinamidase-related amidase